MNRALNVLKAWYSCENTATDLNNQVERAICLLTPEYFPGVGAFCRDFTEVDDRFVIDLLPRGRPYHESERYEVK